MIENVDQGWSVFPLAPGTKIPLFPSAHPEGDPLRGTCKGECGRVGHGVYDATKDPEKIRSWWTANPNANIGVATGAPSGFDVLDIDGEEGEASLAKLEAIHGKIPLTMTVRTPNGRHIYFKHTPGLVNGVKILPGLDIRTTGGYVVAPPSVVDSRTYGFN